MKVCRTALLLGLLLAGCESATQQAKEWCKAIGEDTWTCVDKKISEIQADRDARRAAALMMMGAGMMNYGAAISAPQPAYQPPVTTHCFWMGSNLTCTSY